MKILDSSVVILFLNDIGGKEYLALLSRNNVNLHIPDSVYNEIIDDNQVHDLNSLISQKVITKMVGNNPSEEVALKRRFPNLGNGEINVLCWGLKLKDSGTQYYCVIDEKLGRNAATKLQLHLTGSIGLLRILKERKLLSSEQLKIIVEDIKKSPFRVSEEVLRSLVDE